MSTVAGMIILSAKQQATYIVHKDFNYYVQLSAGSTIVFKSKFGQQININHNIWGPGNMTMVASCKVNADIGIAPNPKELKGLTVFRYSNLNVTEEIL